MCNRIAKASKDKEMILIEKILILKFLQVIFCLNILSQFLTH
jgi:hypothetical protein